MPRIQGSFIAWLSLLGVPAMADVLPFIAVSPTSTTSFVERGSGKPFVAVGVNYFSPNTGWAPKLWQQFNEQTVRQDMELLHRQGFNSIRVFLTYDSFHREPGKVHNEGCDKFLRLVQICRESGIYVNPSGPDHWEGTPSWRRDRDPFADETVLQADEAWWKEFVARFKDEPAILAWDLFNEPIVKWDTPAMKAKWNLWLKDRYGSTDKIAGAWNRPADSFRTIDEIAIPPKQPALNDGRLFDYQRFRETIGDNWTRRLAGAIRSSDPNHLVTIGHIQWAAAINLPTVWHYAGFDPKENAHRLDFMTIHFYPLVEPRPCDSPEGITASAVYLEAVLHEFSVGKPLMIGEFSWYGGGELKVDDRVLMPYQSLEDQVKWGRKLLEVSRGRVCGWLHWAFADTPASTDLTRWSGLWTADMKLKPWGEVYSRFAREQITETTQATQPAPPRPYPARMTTFTFDRKAMLTDPNIGKTILSSWRESPATRPSLPPG